jgi:hypothetical protein
MAEQLQHAHRFGRQGRRREVPGDWRAKVDLALVGQRQNRKRQEGLADRADLEQVVGADRLARFQVGEAKREDGGKPLRVGDAQRHARQAELGYLSMGVVGQRFESGAIVMCARRNRLETGLGAVDRAELRRRRRRRAQGGGPRHAHPRTPGEIHAPAPSSGPSSGSSPRRPPRLAFQRRPCGRLRGFEPAWRPRSPIRKPGHRRVESAGRCRPRQPLSGP